MAKPTVTETAVRVVKAFRKIGIGGKYATYDVTARRDGFIELHKHNAQSNICFKVITTAEVQDRAQGLIQNIRNNLLEVLRLEGSIPEEMYVAVRLVQNMQVGLYASAPINSYIYFDALTKTVIVNYGKVVIEICYVNNYAVDITTNALLDYVEQLSELIDECKNATDIVAYTRWDNLHIKLGNGYIIETEVTVKEFNEAWG